MNTCIYHIFNSLFDDLVLSSRQKCLKKLLIFLNNVVNITLNKLINKVENKMVNQLLDQAIKETAHLLPGEEFLVKDLFKGYEWKRYAIKDRLLLGTLFLNQVKGNPSLRLEVLDKTSSNQQRYKKK